MSGYLVNHTLQGHATAERLSDTLRHFYLACSCAADHLAAADATVSC